MLAVGYQRQKALDDDKNPQKGGFMKLFKKTMLMVMVVAMLASIMVLPASAAVNSTVKSKMTSDDFPYLYLGVSDKAAVKALQKFLMTDVDNVGIGDILIDGLDGGYGDHCMAAVRDFQVRHGILGPNGNGTGEVKNQTWGAIADVLSQSGTILRNSGTDVYMYMIINSQYYFFYYDMSGKAQWFDTL